MRLDQRLRQLRPDLSWTKIRDAIARGQVLVNGRVERDAGAMVNDESTIDVDRSRPPLPSARLDLPKLYEDEEVLVVDKPAGLLTVPTAPELKEREDTVLRRVQEYARHLHGRRSYAGVLHRLDRDTSGTLAIALSRDAHRAGRELFARHEFSRWYLAIVHGVPARRRGSIDAPISNDYVSGRRRVVDDEAAGRHAVTHYAVRDAYRGAALLELELETGRPHQIRLHLQRIGHPLVGEKVYLDRDGALTARRQMLHAWRLEFPHPHRARRVSAEAPVPQDMAEVIEKLRRSVRK